MASRRDFLACAGGAWLSLTAGCGRDAEPEAPFAVPSEEGIDLVTHVLSRCTFGIAPGDRDDVLSRSPDARRAVGMWIEEQLHPERIDDGEAERAIRRFDALLEPVGQLYEYKPKALLADLASATLLTALRTRRQLHAVMVELFTDHFNIDMSKGDCAWLKAADDRDVIRRHALGRFSDLLAASARSPAMLWYLDGRLNRRVSLQEQPNENYARELLELHTLGVHGGYSQKDVSEAARCLTGFTVRPKEGFRKGAVEFHQELHDDGPKIVLGHRIPAGLGERDLPVLLDLAARHGSTARHIATKLCRRFIADDPPQSAVEAVATAFRRTDGDLRETLRALLARREFLDDGSVRGAKVKRPFHYLVSALRATDARIKGGRPLLLRLAAMGHEPFTYPTPDGYPAEPAPWLDGLLSRFQTASSLASDAVEGTRIAFESLLTRAGGEQNLLSHLLGRRPTKRERSAWAASGGGRRGLALLLASPAFQRF